MGSVLLPLAPVSVYMRGQTRTAGRAAMNALPDQATAEWWGNLDEATFLPKRGVAA